MEDALTTGTEGRRTKEDPNHNKPGQRQLQVVGEKQKERQHGIRKTQRGKWRGCRKEKLQATLGKQHMKGNEENKKQLKEKQHESRQWQLLNVVYKAAGYLSYEFFSLSPQQVHPKPDQSKITICWQKEGKKSKQSRQHLSKERKMRLRLWVVPKKLDGLIIAKKDGKRAFANKR